MATIGLGTIMRAAGKACLGAGIALMGAAFAGEGLDVKMQPLHFGGLQEMGLVHSGLLGSTPIQLMDNEWIDHFGTFLTQEAIVNDRLVVKGGLGGIFEFPKPEKSGEEFGGSQYKLFYIGPSDAEAMYHFGGVENGIFSLGGGMFPFKYNPDANDLGDYLFRSGPYPTYIMTGGLGGLTAIGDQFTVLEGFHANLHAGNLNIDALLTTETGLPPLYDWSLGLVADYKLADGLLDLGAGVACKRLIQVIPHRTVVKQLENSYFRRNGVWYSGQEAYYRNPATFLSVKAEAELAKNTHADSVLAAADQARSDALMAIATDSLALKGKGPWVDSATGLVPGASYYTPGGILLMARASLDLKKVFTSPVLGPEDLRLYAEAAILGVKDYPVFYQSMLDRVPIMVGFNLPTFRILDLLSVQWEYFNSPNLNDTYTLGEKNWAIPYLPEDNHFSRDSWNDLTKKDNFAWSIVARRKILHALTLNAQVARDHMRTIGTDWFYGSRFEPNEILHKTSSWYAMFQLAWNI